MPRARANADRSCSVLSTSPWPFAAGDALADDLGCLGNGHAALLGDAGDVEFDVAVLPLSGRVVHQRDQVQLAGVHQSLQHADGRGEGHLEPGMDAVIDQQVVLQPGNGLDDRRWYDLPSAARRW